MDKTSKSKLTNDIENRLDNFFGEGDSSDADPTQPLSLEKLKTVVLSIDWEITDACLDDLSTEIDVLLPQCQHDRLIHALLRMLKSLGGYIRNLKARAHPDAIKRVMSAFASLENLVENRQITNEEKRRILANEIAAFKHLKQQVEKRRDGTSGPSAQDEDTTDFVENQKFQQAMSDVERRLNEQVALLKSQLDNVQKEIDALRDN